jgi:hypothetical protein
MKTRRKRIALGVAAGSAGILVFVAAGAAFSPHGPHLTNVATPNTRSDGLAPAAKLSAELQQIVWAQGSTKLENPSALSSYYGYDNDTLNSAGQPKMVPTPTAPNANMEAHRPSRTRTRTWSSKTASEAPTRHTTTGRTSCSRVTKAVPRTRMPARAASGTSRGSTSTRTPLTA